MSLSATMHSPQAEGTDLITRSYQQEMFEESMKQNIIVATDTGSGKTHIAVLRIAEELKRCRPDQIVWFSAPKVALCDQQCSVLQRAFPGFGIRLLSGEYADRLWTSKKLWDATMANIRIVVSTPAVLLDAVATHAFIPISRLALIVVDEAHGCVGKNPMNVFMSNAFTFAEPSQRPHILGLSASPAMKANITALKNVETSLHAIAKTPKVYASDLAKTVNRPETSPVWYDPDTTYKPPMMLCRLDQAMLTYDMKRDPYILELVQIGGEAARSKAQDAMTKRKTFCLEQLKALHNRATEVNKEVGPQAAEGYIVSCKNKLDRICHDGSYYQLLDWTSKEKLHLQTILQHITNNPNESRSQAGHDDVLSDKFQKLVDILVSIDAHRFTGLIFAQQRAVVATIASVLSTHPATKDRFRIGCFVGSSSHVARKANIADLADIKGQQSVLQDFRLGDKNVIVSTEVLQEGLDVPACNTIISYDQPPHLVSYIQRRGRARQQQSRYMIFFPRMADRISQWSGMEREMIKIYQDEDRKAQADVEDEEQKEPNDRVLRIGATLTMESSVGHLHHFCQTLGGEYVNRKPRFTITIDEATNTRTARVLLPSSIDPQLRVAFSIRPWKTRKAAFRDAALVAYEALYHAGLINDNLLPAESGQDIDDLDMTSAGLMKAIVPVANLLNPWLEVAARWKDESPLVTARITLEDHGKITTLLMICPTAVIPLKPVKLYWNAEVEYTIRIEKAASAVAIPQESVSDAQRTTQVLLSSLRGDVVSKQRTDFAALFVPDISLEELASWLETAREKRSLETLVNVPGGSDNKDSLCPLEDMLIYDESHSGSPYLFQRLITAIPSEPYDQHGRPIKFNDKPKEALCAVAKKLPKRRDFLHAIPAGHAQQRAAYTTERYIPVGDCSVASIPSSLAVASFSIPSILHVMEVHLVAETLRTGLLAPVGIRDVDLVLTAISSSVAQEQHGNYQRLEFLGDCMLKLCTTLQVLSTYPMRPEAYLTAMKGQIVSNDALANAALLQQLDPFIITKTFTGTKWQPPYVDDVASVSTRQMSKKVLADVVEALIGAAYLDSTEGAPSTTNSLSDTKGLSQALACISLFLTDVKWQPLKEMQQAILTQYTPNASTGCNPTHLAEAERLIGRTFTSKSILLTALTHPSYNADMLDTNYERIEFLGDAILDYVVTSKLFAYRTSSGAEPPHQWLHTVRTALVNAAFLAFLCMEHSVEISLASLTGSSKWKGRAANGDVTHMIYNEVVHHHLPDFLQRDYSAHEFTRALFDTWKRHGQYRESIATALRTKGARYPWADLQRLSAPKALSDIIESCLAAVWIDTKGDTGAVEAFLENIGLLKVLRKLVSELDEAKDLCLHPKQELGQLAAPQSVEYVVEGEASTEEPRDPIVRCAVMIGGIEVAYVHEARGHTKLVLETCVADKAVKEWEDPGKGAHVLKTIVEAAQGVKRKGLQSDDDDDDDEDS